MRAVLRAPIYLFSILAATAIAASVEATTYSEPGNYRVASSVAEWTDAARHRMLPVKVYSPQGARGDRPVVFFSHGLGGSREGGKEWGEQAPLAAADLDRQFGPIRIPALTITVAFWNAYLRGDADAKAWLASKAPHALGSMAQFRAK